MTDSAAIHHQRRAATPPHDPNDEASWLAAFDTLQEWQPERDGALEDQSAGGVVVRTSASGQIYVALMRRRDNGGWDLPKGHLEGDERPKQAAIREVREELGLDVIVLADLAQARYNNYSSKRKRTFRKAVNYYLMREADPAAFRLGHTPIPDYQRSEVLDAAWVHIDGAIAACYYRNTRMILERAAFITQTHHALLYGGVSPSASAPTG